MAARLNPRHTESCLARIRTSQLINRLQKNALGLLKCDRTGRPLQLTDGQIRSAVFLIERTIARAEVPKQLNVEGNLAMTVITGVPGQLIDATLEHAREAGLLPSSMPDESPKLIEHESASDSALPGDDTGTP